jgi:hypothetical protein
MQVYLKRMKQRLKASQNGELQVKVFDDSTPEEKPTQPAQPKKAKKKPKKKKKTRK